MKDILRFMDRHPVIEGERLILRRMVRRDAADLYRYASDPRVSRYLLWQPHPSLIYTERYLEEVLRQYRAHTFYDFALILKEEDRMIGTCGFTRIDPDHNSCEIGYVLSAEYWHRGLGSEAVALILRYAFSHLGFHRVQARYMVENIRSRHVMEKNGMVFEGVAVKSAFAGGEYHDVGTCAILREDYDPTAALTFTLRKERPRRFFLPFSGG